MTYNVYDNPEKFDLRVAWSHSEHEEYDWSIEAVFLHDDGTILFGDDSGCSCNLPFQDFELSDLQPIRSRAELRKAVGPVVAAELLARSDDFGLGDHGFLGLRGVGYNARRLPA